MDGTPTEPLTRQAQLLTHILKTLRKDERRMTVDETAEKMGIAPRTYQEFEAAGGKLDFNKVRLFATAARSDAIGITLGVMFEDPDLATQTMDNKLLSTFWVAFKEFRQRVGARLALVPPALWLAAFRRAFEEVEAYLAKRSETTEEWLERKIAEAYQPNGQDLDDPGAPER